MEYKQFLIKEDRQWLSQYFEVIDESQKTILKLTNKMYDHRKLYDQSTQRLSYEIKPVVKFLSKHYHILSGGALITTVKYDVRFTFSEFTFDHLDEEIRVIAKRGYKEFTFYSGKEEIAKAARKSNIWKGNDDYGIAMLDRYDPALFACVVIIMDDVKDNMQS